MGNSKRKTPMTGTTTAETEKKDKRIANRRDRHANKQILNKTLDDTKLKDKRETSNVYSFDKDGKQYFGHEENQEIKEKLMRK